MAAYERDKLNWEAAKRAAALFGTSDRKALCSPPINNGADAVTDFVAVTGEGDCLC